VAVVDGVKSSLRMGKEALGHVGLGAALNLGFAYFDYRGRVSSGQNPVVAGAVAGAMGYLGATMGVLPFMAITAGPGLMKAGVQAYHNYYQSHSAYTRRMTMPFSHSFSHSDATYQIQQKGMAAMGQARGALGVEAGMMNQMYGRR
jgi:hypothetical protein